MTIFKKHPIWSTVCAAAIAFDIVDRSWGWLLIHGALAALSTIVVDRNAAKQEREIAKLHTEFDVIRAGLPGAMLGALLFKVGEDARPDRCFALNKNGTLVLPPEMTQEHALRLLWILLRPPESEQSRPPDPPLRKSAA